MQATSLMSHPLPEKININQRIEGPTVVFTSSVNDPDDVDIICRNSQDFSALAGNYGFTISFQTDDNNFVFVRLTQASVVCDWRKVFLNMENRLKCFKTDTVVNTSPIVNSEPVTPHRTRVTNESPSVLDKRLFLDLCTNIKGRIEDGFKTIKRVVDSDEEPQRRARFIDDCGMNQISHNNTLLERIMNGLKEEKYGASPLKDIRTIEERRWTIKEFINLLQNPLTTKTPMDEAQKNMLAWFKLNASNLLLKLTPEQVMKKTAHNKKYLMLDDIVGSVHYLQYEVQNIGTVILAMAISDWKVVGSYIGETKEDALWGLYTLLKDKRKPNEKYKFVVNCHYKDGYSDVFTPFYRDGYEHNEKVIIWIKKNFIFVHYPQAPSMPIAAMFNFFSSFY